MTTYWLIKKTFAFETTLSTKSYKNKIKEAQLNGYHVTLLFFWLESEELALKRVQIRVLEGGHNIEKEIIERRFKNGVRNLFDIYLDIVDEALIFDNTYGNHDLIAEKEKGEDLMIINDKKFNLLKSIYDKER